MVAGVITRGTRTSGRDDASFELWDAPPRAVYHEWAAGELVTELSSDGRFYRQWDRLSGQLYIAEAEPDRCYERATDPLFGYWQMVSRSQTEWQKQWRRFVNRDPMHPIQSIEFDDRALPKRVVAVGNEVVRYRYAAVHEPAEGQPALYAEDHQSELVAGYEMYETLADSRTAELTSYGGVESLLRGLVDATSRVAQYRYSSHRIEGPIDTIVWKAEPTGHLYQMDVPARYHATDAGLMEFGAADELMPRVSGPDPDVVRRLREGIERNRRSTLDQPGREYA